MFDPIDAFTRQFTPTNGGYLYYPSRGSGGKLVTNIEYEQLLVDWQKVSGPRGQWKIVGIVSAIILVWTVVSQSVTLAAWAENVLMLGCVTTISAWFFWASRAPHRLVSGRPDVTPPRSASETKRKARALLSWRLVFFVLLSSGVALIGAIYNPDLTPEWWAWLIVSGVLFATYGYIAILKAIDRHR